MGGVVMTRYAGGLGRVSYAIGGDRGSSARIRARTGCG